MTFYIQGLVGPEVMPLTHLFKQSAVAKARGVAAENRVDPTKHRYDDRQQHIKSDGATQLYKDIEHLTQASPTLFAHQVMKAPVVFLKSNDLISTALNLFHTHQIRHIPVVADSGIVEGIISDRDILRDLSGVSEDYEQHVSSAMAHNKISQLMKTQVLTASSDTDVRYIARLFVEQKVGAMPIVVDGGLVGIITRSDILAAVMRHFILELWT